MRDKRNILCICNTYFQLIVAIRLRLTQFSDDNFYLIVSDESTNAESVVHKLQNEKIFSQVFLAETRSGSVRIHKIHFNNPISVFRTALKCISDSHKSYNFAKRLPDIDIVLFYNDDYLTRILYSGLIKKNSNMVCSRFEEGLASYIHASCSPKRRIKAVQLGLQLFGGNLEEQTNTFYCFFPELYGGRMTPVAVQRVQADDKQFVALLKRIFSILPENLCYTQKYIYFATPFDSDNHVSIEFDLIQKLANILGKENMLIKMHPRDRRTVFEDNGYLVDRNSAIPWEVLQFCIDLSDKVLLSTFSSSVLSSNAMLEGGAEIRYLYELCEIDVPELNVTRSAIEKTINKLQCKGVGESNKIKVIKNIEEVKTL